MEKKSPMTEKPPVPVIGETPTTDKPPMIDKNKKPLIGREIVFQFLIENKNIRFTKHQIFKILEDHYEHSFAVNYATISRHVDVLADLGKIHLEQVGRISVVWYG